MVSRIALSAILGVAAVLKVEAMGSGLPMDVPGGRWGSGVIVALEAVLVCMLWAGPRLIAWAAVGAIMVAIGGIAVSFADPEASCGCMGRLELARWQHLMLAATVGALGGDVLRLTRAPTIHRLPSAGK